MILNRICFSQENSKIKNWEHGLFIGISMNEVREKVLNNLTHSGYGLSGGYMSINKRPGSVQQFEFSFNTNFSKSKYETETGSYIFNVNVKYRYFFNRYGDRSGVSLLFGPAGAADINILYFENWDENHYYWLTAYSIGIAVRYEYAVKSDHILCFEGDMPIVSVVSRPPENDLVTQADSEVWKIMRQIHEDPRLSLITSHTSFTFQAGYSFLISKRIKPTLFWKINYLKSDQMHSDKFNQMYNTLGIKLFF